MPICVQVFLVILSNKKIKLLPLEQCKVDPIICRLY